MLRHFGVIQRDARPLLHREHDGRDQAGGRRVIAFSPARSLLLSQDNHNSVNGLREYASRAGSAVRYVALDDELKLVGRGRRGCASTAVRRVCLRFPRSRTSRECSIRWRLSRSARAHGWRVLLDAASFVPSHPLNLSRVRSRFRAGFVLQDVRVSRPASARSSRGATRSTSLRRPWFAGGTVDYVSVQHQRHQLRPGHEGFEDGTPRLSSASPPCRRDSELLDARRSAAAQRTRARADRAIPERAVSAPPRQRPRRHRPFTARADACSRGGAVAFNVLRC